MTTLLHATAATPRRAIRRHTARLRALALGCAALLAASCSASRSVKLARPLAVDATCTSPPATAPCDKGAGEAPRVVKLGSPAADGHYKAGQELRLTAEFTRPVFVRDDEQLGILLETGTVDRLARYAAGSGTSILEFVYVVQEGDLSDRLDCVAEEAGTEDRPAGPEALPRAPLSAGLGGIADEAGTPAILTLPPPGGDGSLGALKSIVIDTKAPTLSNENSFRILPPTETAYRVQGRCSEDGQPVRISGSVEGTTTCRNGAYDVSLDYSGIDDGPVEIVVNLSDVAGNAAPEVVTWVTKETSEPDPGPAVVNEIGTTSTRSAVFGVGDTLVIHVYFSRPVFVTDAEELGITLETGATDRLARYAGGSGSRVLLFVYKVAAGDGSSDLDYIAASPFSAGNGSIVDSSGHSADLSLPEAGTEGSLSVQADITVDGAAP